MKPFSNFVSLHPYFKAHPEKLEAAKAIFSWFVEPPSQSGNRLRRAKENCNGERESFVRLHC